MHMVSDAQGCTQGGLVEAEKPFFPHKLFEKAIVGYAIFLPVLYQPPKCFRIFLYSHRLYD